MRLLRPLSVSLFLLLMLALAGCAGDAPAPAPTPALVAQITAAPASSTPAPAATPRPTATATVTASLTATPSPTATPTITPSPTATPLHPLSVLRMRQEQYPGSEIVIEQKLTAGANYQRYYVSYRSEGLKIYALMTVPNGNRPATGWPAIIFNHGYIPPAQYRTTERYVAYVDYFARRGYVVFRPDYRGHASSEGEATGGYGSPAYTIDVLNAVASVKMYPAVDPNRLGMWGHSMGGQITLRTMVTTKDIKAGVIWAGVIAPYPDIISRWRRPAGSTATIPTSSRRWRQELVEQYGPPDSNPAFWAEISPTSYLADLSGPLQLHHGTADTSVPIAFSQNLYTEAQKEAVPVEVSYFEYKGDDHNLARSFNLAMQRSVAFFDRYVKNAGS